MCTPACPSGTGDTCFGASTRVGASPGRPRPSTTQRPASPFRMTRGAGSRSSTKHPDREAALHRLRPARST
jgi:hypothetical protein